MSTSETQPECASSGCDPSTSSSELMVNTSMCDVDSDCSGKTPRCLAKACVDRRSADYWLCPANDKTVMTATVRYGFHVVDFLSRAPPKGVRVNACRNMDIGCSQPVATSVDTDGTGEVQVTLPTGFTGYFEVRSEGEMDTLLYVTQPIVKNTRNRDLPVLTPDIVDITATTLGTPYDMEKGIVLMEAIDCSGTPQGGIHFATMDDAIPFYLINQLPTKDQMLTVYDPTNNTADGGYINVPAGFATFSAQVGTDEDALQLGMFNAQIRPNTITFIDMQF